MTKSFNRVVAMIITVMMVVSMLPMAVFASIPNWEENNVVFDGTSFGTNGYYNVISKKVQHIKMLLTPQTHIQ